MGSALNELIEATKGIRATAQQREDQRRSFAYGNTALENPLITREMVDAKRTCSLKSKMAEHEQRHSRALEPFLTAEVFSYKSQIVYSHTEKRCRRRKVR
jgi:hypothetical protein